MTEISKKITTFIITFTLLFTIPVFAASGDLRSSYVEFVTSDDGVCAQAFVKNIGVDREAILILASYDASGALTDTKIARGANGILKTDTIASGGNTLKAFVWENSIKSVVSNVATYNAPDVLSGLEVLFDGMLLEEYTSVLDTPLNFSSDAYTYTIDMGKAGKSVIPTVTASVLDNSAEVLVNTDSAECRTVVTVRYIEDGNKTSAEYVINYVNFEDIKNSIANKGSTVMHTGSTVNRIFAKEYDITESNPYQKVKIDISDATNLFRNSVVAIIPDNSEDKGNVVVQPVYDETGTIVTGVKTPEKVDDLPVIDGKNADGSYKYGKISKDKLVTVSTTSATSTTHPDRLGYVRYDFKAYDEENFVSGAMIKSTYQDREYTLNDPYVEVSNSEAEILGCEYIPLWATSGPQDYQLTLEFYIQKSAKIVLYYVGSTSVNPNIKVKFDDVEVAYFSLDKTQRFSNKYYNYMSLTEPTKSPFKSDYGLWNLILAIMQYGGIDFEEDFYTHTDGEIVPRRFTLNKYNIKIGSEKVTAETIYKLRTVDSSGTVLSNDPRLYEEDGTTAKSVDNILKMLNSNPNNDLITIDYINPVLTEAGYQPQIKQFSSELNIFNDNQSENDGQVLSHMAILGLTGADVITGAMEWYSSFDAYKTSGEKWYSFNVNQPAEIYIYADSAAEGLFEDIANWKKLSLDGDAPIISQNGGSVAYSEVYMREANKGEKISITTPGSDVKFFVAVKPVKKVTANPLDGKKIIFIGNSFTYYGKAVIDKGWDVYEGVQEDRSNDKGYFYQLCKSNGAEVSVTNWTWGGHALSDTFSGEECTRDRACKGYVHLDYLTDLDFDYVVMQQGSGDTGETILNYTKKIKDIFKAVNPDVKFVYIVQSSTHFNDKTDVLNVTKEIEADGITVVDWGNLVYDIATGAVSVPGATESYNKNSFIIQKSASDGYHPNMLTGYITSLMAYCAITGESAVGQDYSFCNDSSINSAFNFDKFISNYYTYDNATTNFPEVFGSKADMKGIQKLVDKYLIDKPYLTYDSEI